MSLALTSRRAALLPGRWVSNELWRRARAVPSLDLRFAENKSLVDSVSGQSLITFTRASSGTYVDSDGVIRSAANDAPRFDHNPVTGESLGLLIEEQRQNLLRYSEEADNPEWNIISSSVTVDPDVVIAPDGTQTADKVKEAATTGGHTIEFTGFAFEAGVPYACSIFVKAAERSRIRITFPIVFTNRLVFFDLNPNSYQVISDGGTTASITPVGNDWFRVAVVSTATTASPGARIGITLVDTGTNVNYTGDGTSGIYVWGAQLEAGAFPTSYIPTAGTTVTRNADVAQITGPNFSRWYSQSKGTVFADVFNRALYSGTNSFPYIAQFDDGTNAERISLDHSVLPGGYRTQYIVRDGDVNQATITAQYGLTTGAAKWSAAYGLDSFATSSNGVVAITDSSGTVPTVNRLQIGTGFGTQYNGTIRRLTYWPQRLPDSTLQNITL